MNTYELLIDEDITTGNEVDTIAFVTDPANDSMFLAFSEDITLKFEIDEEAREIIGAVLIPEQVIDRPSKGFKCFFAADTIKQIAQRFFAKGYQNNLRLTHNGDITDATVYQSFIVDTEKNIHSPKDLNLPNGSWVIGVKVNNDEAWQRVKNGEFRGFSVEGKFKLKDKTEDIELQKQLDKIKVLNQKLANKK